MVGNYIQDLKETVENAFEKAGVEKSTRLAEYLDTFLSQLLILKKLYAAALEIIKVNGPPNEEEIKNGVEAVVDRVRKGISDITDEIVAAVSNTSEEREEIIESAIQKLEEMMQIEPGQVVATLRKNGSKLNEGDVLTQLDLVMDAYLVLTIEHTEIMKDWVKNLWINGINAWNNADSETLVIWETGLSKVIDRLDETEVQTWQIIDAVKASGSAPLSGYQEMIDGTMNSIKTSIDSIDQEIANKSWKTPEEIKADVKKYVKTLINVLESEWAKIEAAISSKNN